MKLVIILSAYCIFLSVSLAQEKEYRLPEVVVTAGRVPMSLSELTRDVIIISADEIKKMPVNNLQDILKYVPGLDLRQRGTQGVQADVGIRGGTSEETLIMIDGFKVNDPQTGHHNLNLPLSPDDIDHIEILKGEGSKSFGADAFSGVINFITKKNSARNISLRASGGQNGYYDMSLNSTYSFNNLNNHISFSRYKSDGYRHNTDFNNVDFLLNSSLNFQNSNLRFLAGYNDKQFGANGFYSAAFPDQWEHTTTKLVGLGGDFGNEIFSITPKIYWRRNNDRFLLNFANPSFYENIHQTDIFGYEIQSAVNTFLGTTSLGGEFIKDKIVSSNLKNHSRETKGIFAEHKITFDNFTLSAGAFAYSYPDIGWKFWPGFDFSYHIIPSFKIYGSTGKAFRIPTYTDLYYSGGGSIGNPNLHHEETTNYEAGIQYGLQAFSLNVDVFHKQGKNIIDWFYSSSDKAWIANNIADVKTNGIEINTAINPDKIFGAFPVYKLGIGYTYLDLKKNLPNTISRYVLDHLRHQVIINLDNYLPFGLNQTWMIRYEGRINLENHFLVDMQINYDISDVDLFLKATNLFNISYQDFMTIPLPGRWIITGAKINFDFD